MDSFYDSLKKTFVVVLRAYANSIPADSLVLDAGCGMGQLTKFVGKNLGRKAIGIDIDPAPLKVASSSGQDVVSHGSFALFDGERFPFADHRFGLIIAHEVIEHVPEDMSFLIEMHRLLKPSGFLLISTPNANRQPLSQRAHPEHVRHYYPSKLVDILTACGYSIVETCFRRHQIAAFFDRVLSGYAERILAPEEIQPHMRRYCTEGMKSPANLLLKSYQVLGDPLVTWIEQTEFRLLKKRREGSSFIVVCQKPGEVNK